VAVIIFKAGYSMSKKAVSNLLDHSLPNENIDKIKKIIKKHSGSATLKRNSLKARQVGPSKDIDMTLQFPGDTPICECHSICDEIEKQILLIYPNCSISIHSEPACYKKNCNKACDKTLSSHKS
jgi:divalent metal cation (Fe/Co/Zn/Cd) transporter